MVKALEPIIDDRRKLLFLCVEINKKNKDIIDEEARKRRNTKGKNLGKKTDTSDIDAKIQAASNSYEAYKNKLATTDKRFQADEATRTEFMTKDSRSY